MTSAITSAIARSISYGEIVTLAGIDTAEAMNTLTAIGADYDSVFTDIGLDVWGTTEDGNFRLLLK